MKFARLSKYLANCFWLLLPVLALDALFAQRLPPMLQMDQFWRDIPAWIAWPENGLRLLVVLLPLVMGLAFDTRSRRIGLGVYLLGLVAYAAAWMMLVFCPASPWSRSAAGLMAPAYTPLFWLLGIALIGDRYLIGPIPVRQWLYPGLALMFVVFHNAHTVMVLTRA